MTSCLLKALQSEHLLFYLKAFFLKNVMEIWLKKLLSSSIYAKKIIHIMQLDIFLHCFSFSLNHKKNACFPQTTLNDIHTSVRVAH